MTEKGMDMGAISVNPDTKAGGTRKHSTGEIIARGSLLSSTSNDKPLPHYLRPSTSSCHDICKYGWKHAFDAEAKHPFLPKFGNKLNQRKEPCQENNSNLEERRKRLAIKLKSSSHQKDKFPDKSALSKQKAASNIKEVGLPEEHDEMKLQFRSLKQKSSISSDQEVPPISVNHETQAKGNNLEDKRKKQVIKSKTIIKSNSLSSKHKVGARKDMSHDNGISTYQKSCIIKDTISPLQEVTSSIKPKLVKQASLKSCTTHDKPQNLKQKSSVPNEVTRVDAKHVTSKKVNKAPALGLESPRTPPSDETTGCRNVKEQLDNSQEMMKMVEMLKPSTYSPSIKHTGGGTSSLKQRKHKHRKKTTSMENQKVGDTENDTQNDDEEELYVINKLSEKVDLDSPEQKPLETEIVVLDSSKQPLSKCENSDLDSPLVPENAAMDILVQKLQEPDDINFESLELNPDDQKSLEPKNADLDFLEQKWLNPENYNLGSLEQEPDDLKLREPENFDIKFLAQNLLKPGETGIESLEKEPSEPKLFESDNDDIDFLEQKLLIPEDIDLVSLDMKHNDHKLLEEENADVNFLEQKLQNDDLDGLELKSNDDHSSQLATDDDEEIEESESASSEPIEWEPEHDIEENNGNCGSLKGEERGRERRNVVVHREVKLSAPQKLKFGRGKIIELQPESNGPRRLRFRRGRTVNRSANGGQLERKNFQRSDMSEAVADTSAKAQSVVLKHQDMQEKKDAQGLFNNVIEETASKLVETRKSKVKALVGAFETVISLQDGRSESTG